ncbi:MAG: hypothetical protein ACJ79H_19455 [Myxococcales bacterium]
MTTNHLVSRMVLGAVLGWLFFAAPAHAQAISTFTVQASGSVTTPTETVNFSGPIQITATVVNDPAGGPASSVVGVDARQLVATGATSGARFINSGQAQLTRVFGATDSIQTTFAFYPAGPGGFLNTRTALATLNLSYNVTTQALTGATASISTAKFP